MPIISLQECADGDISNDSKQNIVFLRFFHAFILGEDLAQFFCGGGGAPVSVSHVPLVDFFFLSEQRRQQDVLPVTILYIL